MDADIRLARPRFKESPFFTIMGPLSPAQTCPGTENQVEGKTP